MGVPSWRLLLVRMLTDFPENILEHADEYSDVRSLLTSKFSPRYSDMIFSSQKPVGIVFAL